MTNNVSAIYKAIVPLALKIFVGNKMFDHVPLITTDIRHWTAPNIRGGGITLTLSGLDGGFNVVLCICFCNYYRIFVEH